MKMTIDYGAIRINSYELNNKIYFEEITFMRDAESEIFYSDV